jgi:hypothetical protein
MSSEPGKRGTIARLEAEAVAAYRADLEAKVRALHDEADSRATADPEDVDREWHRWAAAQVIAYATVLRLLTDGAEPPKGTTK